MEMKQSSKRSAVGIDCLIINWLQIAFSCLFVQTFHLFPFFMAIDLKQFQQVIESAQQADAFKSDVKRALRKVSSLLNQLQTAVNEAEGLLNADYAPTPRTRKIPEPQAPIIRDEEAPFGRKKDGTPKSKPGRAK